MTTKKLVEPSTYRQLNPKRNPRAIAQTIQLGDSPENRTQRLICYMRRCTEDLDMISGITGPEGSTKSTLAEHLARTLAGERFDEANICTQPRYFLQRLRDVKRRQAVIFDEAGEGLHNRDAMGSENKVINEVLMQLRVRHLYIFLCFPRFESLDLYPREFRIRLWFRCIRPGVAEARIRDWDIPVGKTRQDALNAYVPVCRVKYPAIGKEDGYWEKRETEKETRLKDKITSYLSDTA